MARWKKKEEKPPKPQPQHPCSLCESEMDEEQQEGAMFFASPRYCLMPGWKAIMALRDTEEMPVVWGYAITVACPACYRDIDAYRDDLLALMDDEGVEPMENVIAGPPLTWKEVEKMMEVRTSDKPAYLNVPQGRWVEDVEREAS